MSFIARILMVVAMFVASCADAPSQHDEARFGVVRVSYGPESDWTSQQRAWFDEENQELNAFGATVVRAEDGSAVYTTRHWDSGEPPCQHGAGYYDAATHTGFLDPVCFAGELEFKSGYGHEFGHSLGLTHVCRVQDQMPTGCSPVGTGYALMNPRVSYGDPEITSDGVYQGEVAAVWPHALDLAEFNRVHP